MRRTLERRLDVLEHANPQRGPLLVLWRVVEPGRLDKYPSGTQPAPPYLPAVDRLAGEDWERFTERLAGMVAHLPPSRVVRVVSR